MIERDFVLALDQIEIAERIFGCRNSSCIVGLRKIL